MLSSDAAPSSIFQTSVTVFHYTRTAQPVNKIYLTVTEATSVYAFLLERKEGPLLGVTELTQRNAESV